MRCYQEPVLAQRLRQVLGLQPAPGPHPGPALQDEVGEVAVVVVHHLQQQQQQQQWLQQLHHVTTHPEERVAESDVAVLQVGAVPHQQTRDPLHNNQSEDSIRVRIQSGVGIGLK